MVINAVTGLLAALSPYMWPMVFLFAILFFRKPIKERIANVKELDWKNKVVKFGDVKTDLPSETHLELPKPAPTKLRVSDLPVGIDDSENNYPPTRITGLASAFDPKANVKWGNTGNVFWLGHDLIWTSQVALRAAPKSELLRGLEQAQYHITHLGLSGQSAALASLIAEVQAKPESAMDREWRSMFSGKVSGLVSEVGKLAGKNQPDFERDLQR